MLQVDGLHFFIKQYSSHTVIITFMCICVFTLCIYIWYICKCIQCVCAQYIFSDIGGMCQSFFYLQWILWNYGIEWFTWFSFWWSWVQKRKLLFLIFFNLGNSLKITVFIQFCDVSTIVSAMVLFFFWGSCKNYRCGRCCYHFLLMYKWWATHYPERCII